MAELLASFFSLSKTENALAWLITQLEEKLPLSREWGININ
jgi:hypothetical protein